MQKTNTHFLKLFCVLLGVFLWSGNAWAQPSNDDCANAKVLVCNAPPLLNETTVDAVAEPAPIGCSSMYGVWYTFIGDGTIMTIDAQNNTFDHEIDLFTSDGGCSGTFTQVVCDDGAVGGESYTFTSTVGAEYFIYVAHFSTAGTATQTGFFDLELTCVMPPDPPANDDCADAISIIVNSDLSCDVVTTGTIEGGTTSSEPQGPCNGTANDDVWYSFVATDTEHSIDLININGGTQDLFHAVYSGACGSLTNLDCSDPNSSVQSGLTIGDTYLLRIYSWTSTPSQTSIFDVCIGTFPATPPANDECEDATTLTVNQDLLCGSTTPGTVASATASGQDETICGGSEDDDVWFSFVATATEHEISLLNVQGNTTNLDHGLYNGPCSDLTNVLCSFGNNSTASDLVIGDTYFLRVYTGPDDPFRTTSFDVCIGTLPSMPPANNDCSGVVDLGTLTSPLTQNTCAATNSFDQDCLTNPAAQDIVYSLLIPAGNTLNLAQLSNNYDSKVRLAYGATCPGDILIVCYDDPDTAEQTWINGTGMDQTVYIIISAFSTACGTFELEWEILTPPANDLCADAVALTVASGEMCDAQTLGTNFAASPSGEMPTPTCGDFGIGQDVWYSVVVPASGAVNIEVSDAGGPTDFAVSIYAGTCGDLTELACADDTNDNFPAAIATGRTEGEVLFVRVFEDGSNETGEFNICAFSPAVVCDVAIDSATPADETCANEEDGAITIVASSSFGPYTFTVSGPVTQTNSTGMFTNLPQGTYTIEVSDDGFPTSAGACTVMGGPVTIAGDGDAPVVSCPTGGTINCNGLSDAAVTVDEFIAQGGTIADDCEIASISSLDVSTGDICPSTGQQTITRTYSVTDNSGNVGTCEQNFTILNSVNGPVITATPLDQTVDCAVNAFPQMNLFQASADCGANITYSVSQLPIIGTPGCSGARIQFQYVATDGCGRTAVHTQTYTLANEGPEFICPVDICIIECPANTDMIQTQFDAYSELATVETSCSESEVTITNNFGPDRFISQNCMNPTVDVVGAVAYQVVTFRATDACGRSSNCTALVVIKDNDGPVIEGNIFAGVADCATQNQQPAYDAWANNALNLLSATDECSGSPATFSFSPLSPDNNCQGGVTTTQVTFTATDACGNNTTILANYQIIDFGSMTTATVSGSLMTEENQAVELVEMAVDGGSFTNMMMTSDDGEYEFELETNQNHAITPTRNDDHLNGITSYDLILMGQHLLEIQILDSPYKLIAADVNRSGSITATDMIEMRRLILHMQDEFSNNTSWRFVDADYTFTDLSNPFVTTFPEVVAINNLTQAELRDFVAVKIGDLNGSASPALLSNAGDTRNRNELVFQVEDQKIAANQSFTVDFRAQDFKNILGYQFTLAFDPAQLEMVDFEAGALENLSAENFGDRFKQGVLTSSWNAFVPVSVEDQEILFSINFKANANVNLSDAIRFNSELTSSEAYGQDASLLNLGLEFSGSENLETSDFALLQNRPNPFTDETLIAFTLPENTPATLTIYDVAGRVLKQFDRDFNKGYNEITVNRSDLSGAGLLYYQLETPTQVATMKMIVK